MSSTRTSSNSAEFSQERFASHPAFDMGLLGNLVAKRVALLEDSKDREAILFIQSMSHQAGGCERLAREVIQRYGNRIGTKSLRALIAKKVELCRDVEIRLLRRELPFSYSQQCALPEDFTWADIGGREEAHPRKLQPIPTQTVFDWCMEAAQNELSRHLVELCLNPDFRFAASEPDHSRMNTGGGAHVWYFSELRDCLLDLLHTRFTAITGGMVQTEISRRIWDSLNYALDQKCMVMIDGLSRLGKTFAAKTWCDARPGTVRYVQVPSEGDDLAFYREMARALGVGCGLSMKAQQIRERVKQTILQAGFMVVFDEAHYLWPQTIRSESLPVRLNWVLTTLVNNGIAVGLITTPQFYARKQLLEKKTGWASEQFDGRLAHYEKLPEALSESDLRSVAERHLPEGNKDMIEAVIGFARISNKYLSGIADTVKRARYIASRAGRGRIVAGDVIKAIEENGLPSVFRSAPRMATAPAPSVEPSNRVSAAAGKTRATASRTGGDRRRVASHLPARRPQLSEEVNIASATVESSGVLT